MKIALKALFFEICCPIIRKNTKEVVSMMKRKAMLFLMILGSLSFTTLSTINDFNKYQTRIELAAETRTVLGECPQSGSTYESRRMENSRNKKEMNTERTTGKKYTFTEEISDQEVTQFAKEVKNNIVNGEWEKLAEKICYPVEIGGTMYTSADSFINNDWENAFSDEWMENMKAETCENMSFTKQGLILANGEVKIYVVKDVKGNEKLVIWSIDEKE